MIQEDILRMYEKGLTIKQIQNTIYNQSYDYKTGKHSYTKTELCSIIERTIVSYINTNNYEGRKKL